MQKTAFRQCEAMTEYALSHGLDVEGSDLDFVVRLGAKFPRPRQDDKKKVELKSPELSIEERRDLARAHASLARLVAPATPCTLRLLNDGVSNRFFPFLGRIRLVRHFVFVALVLLAALLVSLFHTDFSEPVFKNTKGIWNVVNLLAAAGLGGAFFGLYTATHYVRRGTYDYKYEASYWARLTLGLVAGILLAVVIPIGDEKAPSVAETFTKPVLALVGGFSADVVYQSLNRFVDTLRTFVEGAHRDLLAAQQEVNAAREATRITQSRTELSALLMALEADIAAETPNEKVRERIRQMLDELLPITIPDVVPRKATPRKATPRKATPRKATPRKATPQKPGRE